MESLIMNSTTLRRLRIYYINHPHVSRTVLLLAAVLLLYLLRRVLYPPPPSLGIVRYKDEEHETQGLITDEQIQQIIDTLHDTRPTRCRDHGYDFTSLDDPDLSVSILTEFSGKQFYDLQLTLASIVDHTPNDLYKEIVVIDDGTSDPVIRKQVARYLQKSQYAKVKLYRSEKRLGQASARHKAAQLAQGTTLVYISCTTLVNNGWIQPLLSHLIQHPDIVVVPHSDSLLSEHRFYRTDDSLVPVFTWSLYTVYLESTASPSPQGLLDAPLMRGDVLAIRRAYLSQLGGFDEAFRPASLAGDGFREASSGHHLELSLRSWLCGGGVKVSTCSRVATHSALRPHRVDDALNYRRVVELWLDQHKPLSYRQGKVSSELSDEELTNLAETRQRLTQLNEQKKCKDFSWYLEYVAKDIKIPSSSSVMFGKIKSKSNYCLRAGAGGGRGRTEWEIDLSLCRQHIYEPTMMFDLFKSGQIVSSTKGADFIDSNCLVPEERTGVVRLEQCAEGEGRQRGWSLINDRLKYRSGQADKCLTQITERDSVTSDLIHYAKLTDCIEAEGNEENARKQIWEFIHY